ncbi:KN motif and ankyrin repeat domain-containing protein 3 isoform X1 [Electrophorus electricus]|uniref:KN motif and ankyrin repeat domain-containing protein 3 isoform X1 n=2 Tax=Electrophorus electricus TaxID=8005 RepID=UPI0015D0B8A3|nr:KN motif and ankyrin repeat domain-containing protein 3 isoform X1 [Electrophorus electricus]XP_026867134.2 KN motif and ankyrin repeat domain-containing protein 3 isoform X1 [Electrophorus electricus]
MTQSVHINTKLPNLGAPFHCASQEEMDHSGSYSVQTPYGFQLDLDFLKYVEEIESGQSMRRANMSPRRSIRGDRTCQRSAGGRTSGWTSTESLASSTSEDGRSVPPPLSRSHIVSCSKSQPLSPTAVFSPTLPTVVKVPPPPPPRNPRVERTLLETSRRLQQDQSLLPNGLGSPLVDLQKVSIKDGGCSSSMPSLFSPDVHLLQMSPSVQNSSVGGWPRLSPENSGRSTPASISGTPSFPPGQLQTVREQMAAALRQLREMEEKVKSVPALEREVAMLRNEKDRLLLALENKTTELGAVVKAQSSGKAVGGAVEPADLSHHPGQERKSSKTLKESMMVEKRSVSVGNEVPLEAVVVYCRQDAKDAAVEAAIDVCHKGMETEVRSVRDAVVQAKVQTNETSAWVMESLLGLSSEAEQKIDNLEQTIRFQQESIQILETRLTQANQDMEEFKAQEMERTSKILLEKETLAKPEMTDALVETELCSKTSVGVGVSDADFAITKTDQSIQTDSLESSKEKTQVIQVSTGIQWENLHSAETHDNQEQAISAEVEATGPLKSIMKRRDASGSSVVCSSGKKSLKFVGILNGGYETTSSEEEEEDNEGSSSDGSAADGCSDSSEEEEAALEDTSDEERNLNLDDTDSEENTPAVENIKEQVEVVKEKFELSSKMREACLILKNHLNDTGKATKSKELLSSTHTVQLEWFRVSSAKTAQPSRVSNYMMAFSEISPALLGHVVNMTDGNGNTALHYSVSHSNFAVVGLLLDTGVCNVDQQNKAGYTAVMLAALSAVKEKDDMVVVKKLFSLGNVNAKASQAGQTALMLAVSHGRQEMVQALLECGASVNVQDDEGSTALMCASEHGRAGIVSVLLEQPACDISIVDNDGSNALSIALEASHNDIAVLLYAHMNYSKSQADVSPKGIPRSPSSPSKTWPTE